MPLDLITGQPLPVFHIIYTPEMAKVLLKFKDHQHIKIADFCALSSIDTAVRQ